MKIFIVLSAIDLTLTTIALLSGKFHEGNPVFSWIKSVIVLIVVLFLAKVIGIWILHIRKSLNDKILRRIAIGFTSLVVISNMLFLLTGCTPNDSIDDNVYIKNLYSYNGTDWNQVTSNGSGTSDHAMLTNLDYALSSHTGFASSASLSNHTSDNNNPHDVTFLQLLDTPDSFSGQGNKVAAVNPSETAIEFTDPIPKTSGWSGNITWNTTSYTTSETDISALFSTNLTGTIRRKYSVYLDLTNVESNASFVSLYLAVKTKIDGTNYRAIDRKTIADADIASNAEPGIVIVIPGINQDTQITMQMSVALSANITICYSVIKEHLE